MCSIIWLMKSEAVEAYALSMVLAMTLSLIAVLLDSSRLNQRKELSRLAVCNQKLDKGSWSCSWSPDGATVKFPEESGSPDLKLTLGSDYRLYLPHSVVVATPQLIEACRQEQLAVQGDQSAD